VLARGTDENGPLGHGWTYSAHPIGAAAGVANLKLLDSLASWRTRAMSAPT
jgi:L-2,4-diaminobutyrate transaminase